MSSKEESQARLRAAYAEALTTLRLGRAATAERQLRAIQAAAPGDVKSLRLLGVALLDQGKTSAALQTLERVLLAQPEFADARVDLARTYRCAGEFAPARAQVRRVLEAVGHGPAHVFGSSGGAVTGLALVSRFPGHVATLARTAESDETGACNDPR